jgi:hypothetical protein
VFEVLSTDMEARICSTLWTLDVRLEAACEAAEISAIGESVCDRSKIPAADSGTFSFEETSKGIRNGSTCLQLFAVQANHERINWPRDAVLFGILTGFAFLFRWSSVLSRKLDVEKPGCLKSDCGPQVK